MGREIEQVAAARGHRLSIVVDPVAQGEGVRRELRAEEFAGCEVAFEFTGPEAAPNNVATLVETGIGVVCGTTGWQPDRDRLGAGPGGAVIAANYSVGMNLFYRIVEQAARCLSPTGIYDRYVLESHHRGKIDAPSGTARALAELIRRLDPAGPEIEFGCPADAPVGQGAIQVASLRAGHEPGSHTVGFDGEHDCIRLTHAARNRGGFALGAVLAAEWIRGRSGLHDFDAVLEELMRKGEQGEH